MKTLRINELIKLSAVLISIIALSCVNNNEKKTFVNENSDTTKMLSLRPNIIESTPSEIEKTVYQEAYDIWYNDKPQEAIELFQKFIKNYPQSSLTDDAQRMIGVAYGNMDNYVKAIEEFEKVKIKYPDSNSTPLSLYELGYLYFFKLNDFDKAKYYYQQFIESATVENEKFRDIAIEQLKNWTEETKRFTGYAEIEKENKKNRQAESPEKFLILQNEKWHKGGFETVGIHSFLIQNTANVSFKDVVISIEYYSESGTLLARNLRTVYKVVHSKETIRVEEMNTGFIPTDASSSKLNIITAIGLR